MNTASGSVFVRGGETDEFDPGGQRRLSGGEAGAQHSSTRSADKPPENRLYLFPACRATSRRPHGDLSPRWTRRRDAS
ncbi:hypothetical protein EYF80_028381 [Liparis tanakae]|uniref:Uncharacterized protein n=1 Tax=Liparis tanakae TaxID=230148 RepID=A0A4Z2H926_9TELE|nr:hypothetical protein EYF80_028381 [Liparis tanakae]